MNIVKNARVTLIILIFITILMIMSASNTHGVEGAPQATSLGMDCGKLVPEFSPDVYEYTVYITPDAENRSCVTTVEFDGNDIEVNVDGPFEIANEDITKTITLSDSDGDNTIYTINVHIATEDEIIENGMLYTLVTNIDSAEIPNGFTSITNTYQDKDIVMAISEDGNISMVPFVAANDTKNIKWYTLDNEGNIDKPMEIINLEGKDYMLIEPSADNSLIMIETGDNNFTGFINSFGKHSIMVICACFVVMLIIILLLKHKHNKKTRNNTRYFRPHLTFEDKEEILNKKR